jgi:elongation factor Ts
MVNITAGMVKELRDKTGAGMMDCKAALGETAGDLEAAVDWLRKKGLAKAAKKAGRVAAEGLIAVESSGRTAVMVEVNSETDFVARNDTFQAFAREVAKLALDTDGSVEAIEAAHIPGGSATVRDRLNELIATIGENMTLRRAVKMEVREGFIATYVHSAVAEGLGRIGVLVALESGGDADKLGKLGRQIAMHVAAASPLALDPESLDPAVVQRERGIHLEQARASGKPENVVEKMVEGRIRKFYEEAVLLKQTFVIDQETPVEKVLQNAAREIGAPVRIAGFARFALGEGIERDETDAAA